MNNCYGRKRPSVFEEYDVYLMNIKGSIIGHFVYHILDVGGGGFLRVGQ